MYTLTVLAASLLTYAVASMLMFKLFGPTGVMLVGIALSVELYNRIEREIWIRY